MTDAFDSSEVNCLSRALELAWRQLDGAGQVNGEGEATAKVALTKAILEEAGRGERDEQSLARYAVTHYRRWLSEVLGMTAPRQPA